MEVLLFVGAILVAVAVVAWRKLRLRRLQRDYQQLPGHLPQEPLIAHRADEIDKKIRGKRCHCGGKLWLRSEATPAAYPHLRVALCECYRCEDTIRLYFQIDYLH